MSQFLKKSRLEKAEGESANEGKTTTQAEIAIPFSEDETFFDDDSEYKGKNTEYLRGTIANRRHNAPDLVTYHRGDNMPSADDLVVDEMLGSDQCRPSPRNSIPVEQMRCKYDGYAIGREYAPGTRLYAYEPNENKRQRRALPGIFCSVECKLAWLRRGDGFSNRLLIEQTLADLRRANLPLPTTAAPSVDLLREYSGMADGMDITEWRRRWCTPPTAKENVTRTIVEVVPERELMYPMLFSERLQYANANPGPPKISSPAASRGTLALERVWQRLGILPESEDYTGLRMPKYDTTEKLPKKRSHHSGLFDVFAARKESAENK